MRFHRPICFGESMDADCTIPCDLFDECYNVNIARRKCKLPSPLASAAQLGVRWDGPPPVPSERFLQQQREREREREEQHWRERQSAREAYIRAMEKERKEEEKKKKRKQEKLTRKKDSYYDREPGAWKSETRIY